MTEATKNLLLRGLYCVENQMNSDDPELRAAFDWLFDQRTVD